MRKCQKCGHEISDEMLFCPECGNVLKEEKTEKEESVVIPYIKKIWEDHLQTINENPETEVRTEIVFLAEHQMYEVKMISESIKDLKVSVAFKKTNNNQKKSI